MNSAIYPEEVEHLAERYGEPRRELVEIEADPEFFRHFQASLRRRRAEVGLVIRRKSGNILLTTKVFYPAGVFRLPTGGIKPGEAVEEALWRELQEETGLSVEATQFAALLEYRMTAGTNVVRFATYLFVLDAPDGEPHCSDPDEEICEFREVSPAELEAAGESLANLGPSWRSWGVWRAVPHRVAAEILIAGGSPVPIAP
ncbi:MAG: NUDIX hydrolase [Armatimonadota bacterium]|nr:NUDIX hydrolase [Armatimonadota bacterium]